MNPTPWTAADFDLRNVIAADDTEAFRDSVEAALNEMQRRLLNRSSRQRLAEERRSIDLMCGAIACAREVIDAAYDARN